MPSLTLRRPGHALRLGVAASGLALVKHDRLFGRAPVLLAEQPLDLFAPDALAPGLRGLLKGQRVEGWPVTVVLADDLVRLWQVTPPGGATRMGDLEAAAALRFQHLFGAPAADWRISADWDAAHPFLAAAMPQALLAQLLSAAKEHRFHLVEALPQFVAAMNGWRRARRPGAWFGQVAGGVLALAAYEGRRLVALRSAVVPDGAGRSWLDAHIAREALRLGVDAPERVQLCGSAPAGWSSSPGRLGFACSLLGAGQADGWSELARLARSGVTR